eukprot:Phypoly_transcript_07938.p1 GENE.Phypoly_transcript_07938~~Phypoly_transcript_07938.p1  ORF type:complete len:362 (+),score=53.22 Phypoly_transcript_07938:472-1557(+)
MRNLSLNAEAFMDPSIAIATKAAWSLLTMLYKQYASPQDEHVGESPLLEWARSLSDCEIPSLKSMSDGKAFLSIITKLAADISAEEPRQHEECHSPENVHENGDDATTVGPPEEPVELALFLTKKYFGIEPPIPANEISSGTTSSILSFLTLLHNVAIMTLTKNQFEEDNVKKHMMIQSLRAENTRLEFENALVTQEVDVMNEQVITEALNGERLKLKMEVIELKDAISDLAKQNAICRSEKRVRELEWADRTLRCRFRFESHVNFLRDYLYMAGDSAAVSDVQNTLIAIRQSLAGTEDEQLNEIYGYINAENEKIHFLEGCLRDKALEDKANEERRRAERAKSIEEGTFFLFECASPFIK